MTKKELVDALAKYDDNAVIKICTAPMVAGEWCNAAKVYKSFANKNGGFDPFGKTPVVVIDIDDDD